MRVRIVIEHLDDVQVGKAVNGVAANARAGGLAQAAGRQLGHRLVGQGAAAGHHADVPFAVQLAGDDADAAAAVRIGAIARGGDAGAIRPEQFRGRILEDAFDLHHVAHRDAFGDADDQLDARRGGFENGVGG